MEKNKENDMETREYIGNTREHYMDFLTNSSIRYPTGSLDMHSCPIKLI